MSVGRVAVIGDIGGHHEELFAALIALGMDGHSLELPSDLAVVQVGDLIHRGPASAAVIDLVDTITRRQPGQWAQLVGNHEAQYLTRQPRFTWDEKLDAATIETVRQWWRDGRMRLAAAVTAPDGGWLVTHAGLTHGFWERVGKPADAVSAAAALNGLLDDGDIRTAFHGGLMIDGAVDFAAGPIWAAAGAELATSWLAADEPPPFHQIHGHSTLVDWNRHQWQAGPAVVQCTEYDDFSRHTAVRLGTSYQIGVDPSFGKKAGVQWKPYLIQGGVLV